MWDKLKRSASWLLYILVIPLMAWGVARIFVPHPRIIGPFLFVSPGIALFVGGAVLERLSKKKGTVMPGNETGPADAEMDLYASNVARKAGIKGYEVRAIRNGADRQTEAVTGSYKQILIQADMWSQLGPGSKEFAMARAFAQMAQHREAKMGPVLAASAGCFVACILSMINLWLILPAQAAFVAVFYWRMFEGMRVMASHADLGALRITRDVQPALAYLDVCAPKRSWIGPGRDKRKEAIQRLAQDLEL